MIIITHSSNNIAIPNHVPVPIPHNRQQPGLFNATGAFYSPCRKPSGAFILVGSLHLTDSLPVSVLVAVAFNIKSGLM